MKTEKEIEQIKRNVVFELNELIDYMKARIGDIEHQKKRIENMLKNEN